MTDTTDEAKAEQERETILQNKRVNDAIQTALERGELTLSGSGWLEAIHPAEASEATLRMAKTLGTEFVYDPKWQKAEASTLVDELEAVIRRCNVAVRDNDVAWARRDLAIVVIGNADRILSALRSTENAARLAEIQRAWNERDGEKRKVNALEHDNAQLVKAASVEATRAARLEEALEGFVRDLTGSLDSRETMLTINHAALCRRIEQACAALSSTEEGE